MESIKIEELLYSEYSWKDVYSGVVYKFQPGNLIIDSVLVLCTIVIHENDTTLIKCLDGSGRQFHLQFKDENYISLTLVGENKEMILCKYLPRIQFQQ